MWRAYAAFLLRNCRAIKPRTPIANKATVLPSGTAVDAENENWGGDPAGGSCVEKRHTPGVGVKPCPEAVPLPVTKTKPVEPGVPPWLVMVELSKSNVNPSTDQKLLIAPELNDHGEAKAVPCPTVTKVAKSPSTLCTCGSPETGIVDPPCQRLRITPVAVAAEEVSNSTEPPNVMLPLIGAACAC